MDYRLALGLEMKSTGEIMGIATSFVEAYAKCLKAAGVNISCYLNGINIKESDKLAIADFNSNSKYSVYKLQHANIINITD